MTGGGLVTLVSILPLLLGFGVGGIAAGSAAAAWQALIGNVGAGSFFASLQSAGMSGTFGAGAASGASVVFLMKLLNCTEIPDSGFSSS